MKEHSKCFTCNYKRVNADSDPCVVCLLDGKFKAYEETQ